MRRLVLLGASGHGRVCSDVASSCGYTDIVFLDDTGKSECAGYEVVGTCDRYLEFLNDSDFFVSIGDSYHRRRFMEMIEAAGGTVVSLFHSSAIIGSDVSVGSGSVIMPGAVINHSAQLGKGVIVNTSASVDHDCHIGDYCHVAVGAHICGTVDVGDNTWIGAGATVINNISLCQDVVVGAGAVVVKDIAGPGTYVGVPAK